MKKKPLVVGLGEVLWDVFPDGKRVGGAPANFAFHANRQNCTGIVVSAVGQDALGDEIENFFAQKNLAVLLSRVPEPTGTVRVRTDDKGVASYVFAESCAWDNLPFSGAVAQIAQSAHAVCFGTLAQRDPRSRKTIHRFLDHVSESALRIFDVNLRQNFYSTETILASLERCSVLKINEDEAPVIAKAIGAETYSREVFFDRIFQEYSKLKIIARTSGSAGSVVVSRAGTYSELPTDSGIRVVDTVGAGDAFTSGLVTGLLSGESPESAHQRAVELAGFVCSRAGAMPDA